MKQTYDLRITFNNNTHLPKKLKSHYKYSRSIIIWYGWIETKI